MGEQRNCCEWQELSSEPPARPVAAEQQLWGDTVEDVLQVWELHVETLGGGAARRGVVLVALAAGSATGSVSSASERVSMCL